ncbi:MAG: dihydrodipicolinate synthase [Fusobacteria bacterium]|nr:MAG: dihydrodipicolinate synthase [Fusobacteriota bacterium]KAF0230059.1 MAG: dihydrodipicolinate [Fusobacteriota bacterium]
MFGRVMTAMVTPFKNNEVNYTEAIKIAKYLVENGSDSILVCGSTGESATMTKAEKIKLISVIREAVNVPILAGTGSNNTADSVEFTKEVDKLGVDGFLIVTPYYNKPNQEGIFQHFKAVAEATDKPIVLYNIPGRCVKEIEVDTIAKLSKIPNISYLKAACGNLMNISMTQNSTDDDFVIYCGDDGLTLPMLTLGAKGVISVASSIIGKEINQMIAEFEAGNTKKAQELHLKYFDVFRDLFCDTNPVPIKYALSKIGFDTEEVRLPMVELDDKYKKIIDDMMKRHNLI